jgi:hypothetical protein
MLTAAIDGGLSVFMPIDLSNTPGIHSIRVGTNHSTRFCYNHVSARHRGNLTNSFLTPRLSYDPGTSLMMIRTSHAACFRYDHKIRRNFLSFTDSDFVVLHMYQKRRYSSDCWQCECMKLIHWLASPVGDKKLCENIEAIPRQSAGQVGGRQQARPATVRADRAPERRQNCDGVPSDPCRRRPRGLKVRRWLMALWDRAVDMA